MAEARNHSFKGTVLASQRTACSHYKQQPFNAVSIEFPSNIDFAFTRARCRERRQRLGAITVRVNKDKGALQIGRLTGVQRGTNRAA